MATATKTKNAITIESTGPKGGRVLIKRKATPKRVGNWWHASVMIGGKKTLVYRESYRGNKTFRLATALTARELHSATAK